MSSSLEVDYLTFSSANHLFALPYHNLVQIVDDPCPTPIPNWPKHVRGCIDYMGEILPLYDLRTKIGYISYREEIESLIENLKDRKQDHLNWISKLRDSVYNNQEITLETNPHKCAFGKWYDNYRTESVNLAHYLSLFKEPHTKIHNLAIEAKKMVQEGREEDAKILIKTAEDEELLLLVKLFDGFESQLKKHTHEYGIVIELVDKKMCLAVDKINYFGKFEEIDEDIPLSTGNNNFVKAIGRKQNGNEFDDVLIVNLKNFVS